MEALLICFVRRRTPQGSVLGPLPFLVSIIDLHNAAKKLAYYLFANDINFYHEHNDLLDMIKTVLILVKK